MPLAVALRLDTVTSQKIEAIWRVLAEEGIDHDREALAYPPHVTLGIYPDDVPLAALQATLQAVTATWHRLPLSLAGFGLFVEPAPVVWIAPVVTTALLALHGELQTALGHLSGNPHYRPDAWVPHVTLSGSLRNPEAAIRTILPHWTPCTGVLEGVDLVRFRPVEIVWQRQLP